MLQTLAPGDTSAKIAVDVVLGESRVFERAFGALSVQLRYGMVRRFAQRMLVSAYDVGFTFDAHV